jgi:hypothetical protein
MTTQEDLFLVSIIQILEIRICFEFRYSDFGLPCGDESDTL